MDQPSAGAPTPEEARAEELVDEITQKAGMWARRTSRDILKRAALAREEAEDIWADARSLSQRERR